MDIVVDDRDSPPLSSTFEDFAVSPIRYSSFTKKQFIFLLNLDYFLWQYNNQDSPLEHLY